MMDGDKFPMKGNEFLVMRAASPFNPYPYPRTVKDGDVCVDASDSYTTYGGSLLQESPETVANNHNGQTTYCAGLQTHTSESSNNIANILLQLSQQEIKSSTSQPSCNPPAAPRLLVNHGPKSAQGEIVGNNSDTRCIKECPEDCQTRQLPKKPIALKEAETTPADYQPEPSQDTLQESVKEEGTASICTGNIQHEAIQTTILRDTTISVASRSKEDTALSVDDENFHQRLRSHAVPFTTDLPLNDDELANSTNDPTASLSEKFVFLNVRNDGAIELRDEDGSEIQEKLKLGPVALCSGDLQKLLEGAMADESFAGCKDKLEVSDDYYDSGIDSQMVSPENSFIIFDKEGRLYDLLNKPQRDDSSLQNPPNLVIQYATGGASCGDTGGPSGAKNFGRGQDLKRRRTGGSGGSDDDQQKDRSNDNNDDSEQEEDGGRKDKPPPKQRTKITRGEESNLVCPYWAGDRSKYQGCEPKKQISKEKLANTWDGLHRIRSHLNTHFKPYKSETCGFRSGKKNDITNHDSCPRHKSAQANKQKGKCLLNEDLMNIEKAREMQSDITEAKTWQKMFLVLYPERKNDIPPQYFVEASIADILAEASDDSQDTTSQLPSVDLDNIDKELLQREIFQLRQYILERDGKEGLERAMGNGSLIPLQHNMPSAAANMIRPYMDVPTYPPQHPPLVTPPPSNTSSGHNMYAPFHGHEPNPGGYIPVWSPPGNASNNTTLPSYDGDSIAADAINFPNMGPDMTPSSSYGSSL